MNVETEIEEYISSLDERKQSEMRVLHQLILNLNTSCKLWFLNGKNSENKVVSNPNIGYGIYTINYTDGSNRPFYQIGLSANKTGISVYIFGIEDKTFLSSNFGSTIGKASITGYCIKFKTIKDINLEVLEAAIKYGFEATKEKGDLKI